MLNLPALIRCCNVVLCILIGKTFSFTVLDSTVPSPDPIICALLRPTCGWAAQHSGHRSWQGGLPWGSSPTVRANSYFSSLLPWLLVNTSSTRNSHFIPIFQLSCCAYCPSCLPAETPSRPYGDNFPLLPARIKKLCSETLFHFKKTTY